MPFDESQLRAFANAAPAAPWVGKPPRDWAAQVAPAFRADDLPTTGHTRASLRAFCEERKNSTEICFVAIMAWGGMRVPNGRQAWRQKAKWINTVEKLRSSRDSRETDYERLRSSRPVPLSGVGPAFFSKLLFFLRPKQDAYILDQWTAKSVQLISRTMRPHIRSDCVTDTNTGADYEWFCAVIEDLAERMRMPPEVIEERLFAGGPRPRSEWRAHVVRTWSPHRVLGVQ